MARGTEETQKGGERRIILMVAFFLGGAMLYLFAALCFGIPFLLVYSVGHWLAGWQFPPSSVGGQVVIYCVGCLHAMTVYRLLGIYQEKHKQHRAQTSPVPQMRVQKRVGDALLRSRQAQGGPPDA
jgi:hypothetical protein